MESKKEPLLSNNDHHEADKKDDSSNATKGGQLSEQRELTEEDIRLGGKPPLQTIILLSVGPLISQLTNALYGIINSIWISKAIGDSGLTAISAYANFDVIGRAFALYLQVSTTTKIASLFGEGLKNEATQVMSDLLRFSFLFALIPPSIFIPLSKIAVEWFGADKEIVDLGFKYIVPCLSLSIIPCFFLICCGCLQAEGRSMIFSITQVVALCLNMFVLCPMFLLGFKTGIQGAAYSTGFAELIPTVVILILYYRGKFGIKPTLKQLLKRPSPNSYEALKLGLAQLILQLSFTFPGLIVRKFMGNACDNDVEKFDNVMAAFNTYNRFWGIQVAVPNAINIGFIPAASYANGSKRFMRIIWFLVHSISIVVAWCSLIMFLTMVFPIQLAKLFSNTTGYLQWSKKFLIYGNVMTFVADVPGLIISLLQAMKKGNLASILSFTIQLIPVPILVTILFFTNKHDVGRLIFCYPLKTLFGVVVSSFFLIFTVKEILKKHKEIDGKNNEELESISKDKMDNEKDCTTDKKVDEQNVSITNSESNDTNLSKSALDHEADVLEL